MKTYLVIFGTNEGGFFQKQIAAYNITGVLKYLDVHKYNQNDIINIMLVSPL